VLEAAADSWVALLLGPAPGQVLLGFGVVEHPPVDDDVQGSIEVAVAEGVEEAANDLAGESFHQAEASQGS
jgi:hypothetical protein